MNEARQEPWQFHRVGLLPSDVCEIDLGFCLLDQTAIRTDLDAAGFRHIEIDRVAQPARAASARQATIATVHGSLIRNVIEPTTPGKLDEATNAVERAIQAKLGNGQIIGNEEPGASQRVWA